MVHLYKELQPTDYFEITLPHAMSSNERQLLTLFYQPLTGAEAISLYLTLWAEAEYQQQNQMTHYYLMNVLTKPIGEILQARTALEAIGLLRTWRKDQEDGRYFVYELLRPLDAISFFNDPLLSMFLYSKIGEQPYRKLRKRFLVQKETTGYQEVTRSFMDVYRPIHTNMPQDDLQDQAKVQKDYPFTYEQFDFDLLRVGLSEQMVPSSSLTLEAKETIAKLAFMYHLSPLDMQKVVINALDDQVHLSTERLKKAAADYYKLTVSRDAPKLVKVTEKKEVPATQVVLTKEQEKIQQFENTPPLEFLKELNGGVPPFPATVELVEDLMLKYQMPNGVVNVLLSYTMLKADMKLPRKYVEAIADHWVRKNLKTAKQAMDLAREEDDKYSNWKNGVTENQSTTKKKYNKGKNTNGRQEKVPDWFYNRQEQPETEKQKANDTVDFNAERLKILQQLGRQDGKVNEHRTDQ